MGKQNPARRRKRRFCGNKHYKVKKDKHTNAQPETLPNCSECCGRWCFLIIMTMMITLFY